MKDAAPPRLVKCPSCSRPVAWLPENRYRPFCSERCRMADLGAWASDSYRIPASGEAPGTDEGEPPQH